MALLAAAGLLAASNAAYATAQEEARRGALEAFHEARAFVTVAGTIITEPTGFAMPQGGGRLSFRMRVRDFSATSAETRNRAQESGVGDVIEGRKEDAVEAGLQQPITPFDIDIDFYGPVSLLGDAPSRPTPEAGEGWTFTGRIQSRNIPSRTQPLLALRCSIRNPHGRAAECDASTWRQGLWSIRRATSRHLRWGLAEHPRALAILRAVLLGYRAEIPHEVHEVFANSGTIHLFAISGLHVMLVGGLLQWLFQRAGLSRRMAGLLTIPAIAAYAILTGGRPSAQRACLMFAFLSGAPAFGRKADGISSLAAAAVALLAVRPLQAVDLGFVFSFSSVLGILLLATPLETIFLRWMGPNPGWILRKIAGALSVSVSAWAVAEPITASVFGHCTPISMVSNLVVIPLGGLMVIVAATGLGVGMIVPAIGMAGTVAAAWMVEAMVLVTQMFAWIPGGNTSVTPWSATGVVLWYAALGVVAFALRVRASMLTNDAMRH